MSSVFLRSDTGMLLKEFIEERDIIESELQTLCSNILENEIDAESRFISILL